MRLEPATCYPPRADALAMSSPVLIDGLEVADEQVVVLSPAELHQDRRHGRRPRRRRGDGHAVG